MRSVRLRLCGVFFLLAGLGVIDSTAAQDLMLTEASEQGFRQLLRMAQNGRLGEDVTNANVGVEKTRVRIELVRRGAPSKIVWLGPKTTAQTYSRYFDVTAGEGAATSDLVRVGSALDEIFHADPFTVAGFKVHAEGDATPGFAAAWADGGWRGIVRVFELRMMAFASVEYTAALLVVVTLGVGATLVLLWGSVPPR